MKKVRSGAAAGLVFATPIAVAALASVTLGAAPAALADKPEATKVTCVSALCTTAATGATDPKIPEAVGD
jgi:hypothetical protein